MKILSKFNLSVLAVLLLTSVFLVFSTNSARAQGEWNCFRLGDTCRANSENCSFGCSPPFGVCNNIPLLICVDAIRGDCDCTAQVVNPLIGESLSSGTPTSIVQKVIVNLVNLAYIAGVVIFFFMLITGGLQWISSGGDKAAVANARSRISHAVIGLIVLMGVFAIVYFMESLFDVDLLRIDIGLISL